MSRLEALVRETALAAYERVAVVQSQTDMPAGGVFHTVAFDAYLESVFDAQHDGVRKAVAAELMNLRDDARGQEPTHLLVSRTEDSVYATFRYANPMLPLEEIAEALEGHVRHAAREKRNYSLLATACAHVWAEVNARRSKAGAR